MLYQTASISTVRHFFTSKQFVNYLCQLLHTYRFYTLSTIQILRHLVRPLFLLSWDLTLSQLLLPTLFRKILNFFSTFNSPLLQLFFVLLPHFHLILQIHLYISIFTTMHGIPTISLLFFLLCRAIPSKLFNAFDLFRFSWSAIFFLSFFFRNHSSLSFFFSIKYSYYDFESPLFANFKQDCCIYYYWKNFKKQYSLVASVNTKSMLCFAFKP